MNPRMIKCWKSKAGPYLTDLSMEAEPYINIWALYSRLSKWFLLLLNFNPAYISIDPWKAKFLQWISDLCRITSLWPLSKTASEMGFYFYADPTSFCTTFSCVNCPLPKEILGRNLSGLCASWYRLQSDLSVRQKGYVGPRELTRPNTSSPVSIISNIKILQICSCTNLCPSPNRLPFFITCINLSSVINYFKDMHPRLSRFILQT